MSRPIVEKKSGISPIWILPLVAICVGGWLLYKSYQDAGIDITIHLDTAAGITAGKTAVVFKGTKVGLVKEIHVSKDLQGVDLTVEMVKEAAPYLLEDVKFWIEKVDIEAGRVTGLDTLLGGSYIGMQLGSSDKPTRSFVALDRRPPVRSDTPGLHLTLHSDALHSIQVGSGIYYKNVMIGSVQSHTLQEDDTIAIELFIKPQYAAKVREGSQFWNASGITVDGGITNLKVHIPSLAAIIRGGIMMATPPALLDSPPAVNGQVMTLYRDYQAAEYGIPLTLDFFSGEGLSEGSTKVMYRGMKLGHIKHITLNKNKQHTVTAQVLLDPRAQAILNSGTNFYLVKPNISVTGVRNLDTLISGVYVTFIPGEGDPKDHFVVQSEDPSSNFAREHANGQTVQLTTNNLGSIAVGSPVLYKKMRVGEVTNVKLRAKEDDVLITGLVMKRYAALVMNSSRFYNTSGVEVTASLAAGLKIQTGTLETLIAGGVSFYNPVKGKVAKNFTKYQLFEDLISAENSGREKIVIHFKEPVGLKIGTKIKYNGIVIGKLTDVKYEKNMSMVRTEARLDRHAAHLLTSGAQFWLVRPEFSLAGTHHLDTLISGPYIAIEPGGGDSKREFTAVSEIKASAQDTKGLKIILSTDDLFSLKAGSPIFYRRMKVGEVVSSEFSSTFQRVHLHAVIFQQFASIIRQNTKFWNASGIHMKGGVFSGIHFNTESLDSLLTGGIALATPNNKNMGALVKGGHQFDLFEEPEESWNKWSPVLTQVKKKSAPVKKKN
jgi:paraquat-inducible protein B